MPKALLLEEFYRRVAGREGVDIETARTDASAVMGVLREAVSPGELGDVMTQLPGGFNTLLRWEYGPLPHFGGPARV